MLMRECTVNIDDIWQYYLFYTHTHTFYFSYNNEINLYIFNIDLIGINFRLHHVNELILINYLNKFCIVIKYQLKIIYVHIKLRRGSVR